MADSSGAPGAVTPRLPAAGRSDADVQGHWLLARLGKRVLRPGGAGLTSALLDRAEVTGADVVELAPGVGRTARDILDRHPRSYVGVDQDAAAADTVRRLVADRGTTIVADAAATGLPAASADVVIGEAMLSMQGDEAKSAVVAEAARVLRPGGRYAVHELALVPDSLPDDTRAGIRQALARSIRVNARPGTVAEWRTLLEEHGLVVDHVDTAPMALLRPRRIIADEGVHGALRFVGNLLTRPEARRRLLAMRRTFHAHRSHLAAVGITARKPARPTRAESRPPGFLAAAVTGPATTRPPRTVTDPATTRPPRTPCGASAPRRIKCEAAAPRRIKCGASAPRRITGGTARPRRHTGGVSRTG